MHMNTVERANKFWHANRDNRITTRQRGDIPGISLAKDVFAFGETFTSSKGERVFVVILNPSKPYVRAYD